MSDVSVSIKKGAIFYLGWCRTSLVHYV